MAITVPVSNVGSLIRTSRGDIATNLPAGQQPSSIPQHLRAQPIRPIISNGYVVAIVQNGQVTPTYGHFRDRPPTVAEWNQQNNKPIGNNLARPGDGKYEGVTGPATFYTVHVGNGSEEGRTANLINNNTSPNGILSVTDQQELVAGLNLLELEEVLPYLDPLGYIRFDTKVVDGITLYYNAEYLTLAEITDLSNAAGAPKMNFPTAVQYARLGHPIARSGWGSEGSNPTTWLTLESGVWFFNSPDGRTLVTSDDGEDVEGLTAPNITAGDLLAKDWMLPIGCRPAQLAERSDLPTFGAEATTPKFDVYNPPCKV